MPDEAVAVEVMLSGLRERYRRELCAKLADIETAWRACVERPWQAETCEAFRLGVHRIAGSAGTYGFTAVGEAALALDRFLSSMPNAVTEDSTTASQRRRIDSHLQALVDAADATQATQGAA